MGCCVTKKNNVIHPTPLHPERSGKNKSSSIDAASEKTTTSESKEPSATSKKNTKEEVGDKRNSTKTPDGVAEAVSNSKDEKEENSKLLESLKETLSLISTKANKTESEKAIEKEIKEMLSRKQGANLQELKNLVDKSKGLKRDTNVRKSENSPKKSTWIVLRKDKLKSSDKASEIVSQIRAGSLSTEQIEKDLEFKKFNDFIFRKLEIIEEDEFGGTIWSGIDINQRKLITIRELEILNANDESASFFTASILKEKEVLHSLKKSAKSSFFCEHQGLYYTLNSDKKVNSLISIVNAGSGSLEELLNIRRARKAKNESAYSQEEMRPLLVFLQSTLKALQENRIYHSDIKPSNITYNEEEKIYQLTGLYNCVKLPPDTDVVSLEDYANTGTEEYISPEKKKYWDQYRSRKAISNSSELQFNPFRCDLWSCSKIIKDNCSLEDSELQTSLEAIANADWKLRVDPKDLNLIEYGDSIPDFQNYEADYLKHIREAMKNNSDWGSTYRRYEDPGKIMEPLEHIEEELKRELETNKGGTDGREIVLAELKYKKAWVLRLEQQYGPCIQEAGDCLKLLQKSFDQSNNRDFINDIISMKLVIADAIAASSKDFTAALQVVEQALEIYRSHFPEEETVFLGEILLFKGQLLIQAQDFDQAKRVLAEDVKLFENIFGGLMNKNAGYAMQGLATALELSGEGQTAAKILEQALLVKKIIYKTTDNIDIADTMFQLAQICLKNGSIFRAKELAEKVVELYKDIIGDEGHIKVKAAGRLLKKIEEDEDKSFNPGMFFFC